jgi:hypothetical protein
MVNNLRIPPRGEAEYVNGQLDVQLFLLRQREAELIQAEDLARLRLAEERRLARERQLEQEREQQRARRDRDNDGNLRQNQR